MTETERGGGGRMAERAAITYCVLGSEDDGDREGKEEGG